MEKSVKTTTTYRLTLDELQEAILFYLRRHEDAREDMDNGAVSIKFRVRAGDYDQSTGQPRALVRGVDIEIEREG